MLLGEHEVGAFDLAFSLAEAVSLLHPMIATHHIQVAKISDHIASLLDLPLEREQQLILAGLLHSVGLCEQRCDIQGEIDIALQYYSENSERRDIALHAEMGYLLLSLFEPFQEVARIIRFHHVNWEEGKGKEYLWEEVPLESHILHLADAVAGQIPQVVGQVPRGEFVLGKKEEIRRSIEERKGKVFMPLVVDAFLELSDKEYFWLDCIRPRLPFYLALKIKEYPLKLGRKDALSLARMIAHIIDFRSPHTATHSIIIGDIAGRLAKSLGFSPRECEEFLIAGYLHDLGKLAVPLEILEKPDKLTPEEFQIVRAHPFYTYHVLEPVSPLERVTLWAFLHHEKLDGSGYPFHYKEEAIPLGARIIAVADVLSALLESRPYREGLPFDEALRILKDMAEANQLDPYVVSVLERDKEEIYVVYRQAQSTATQRFREFHRRLRERGLHPEN